MKVWYVLGGHPKRHSVAMRFQEARFGVGGEAGLSGQCE